MCLGKVPGSEKCELIKQNMNIVGAEIRVN